MRKMTWVLILWCVLMAVWIGYAVSKGNECVAGSRGTYAQAHKAGCELGGSIAITAIIVIWFLGFVVLSLIWFMTRPRQVIYAAAPPPPGSAPTTANWYTDPNDPTGRTLRYFDGQRWTEHTHRYD